MCRILEVEIFYNQYMSELTPISLLGLLPEKATDEITDIQRKQYAGKFQVA
jgi:hypothetical protein